MRKVKVFVGGVSAGILEERQPREEYVFRYVDGYSGGPVSLTMPIGQQEFRFDQFPPFFDGILPEGVMLDGLLRQRKIDKNDRFSQLVAVGSDLIGDVTVEEMP